MPAAGLSASDFRSDTVTRPSPAMRAAMAAAEVGDDVLDGDPTVRRLEARMAALLGKPGSMFVPSGPMANQVALGAWTRPGDEIVVERSAHIACWEAGAPAALHGVQTLTLDAPDGRLDPEELREVARLKSVHCPRLALVCVEQTFLGSGAGPGGRVIPLEHLRALREVAIELGVPVHMDGARLFNAAAAVGRPAAELAECADSVSVSLSKGLGAPVGALIAGERGFLERAMLVRKRLGGWMRQAGVLAAAGLYALEHNLARLADDHALARELARELARFEGLECAPEAVESNVVMLRFTRPEHGPDRLAAALFERGVLALPMSRTALRFMTHLDVGREDVARLRAALEDILG